jgi:hypothetical protein
MFFKWRKSMKVCRPRQEAAGLPIRWVASRWSGCGIDPRQEVRRARPRAREGERWAVLGRAWESRARRPPMADSEPTLRTGRGAGLASPGQRASPVPCDPRLWELPGFSAMVSLGPALAGPSRPSPVRTGSAGWAGKIAGVCAAVGVGALPRPLSPSLGRR